MIKKTINPRGLETTNLTYAENTFNGPGMFNTQGLLKQYKAEIEKAIETTDATAIVDAIFTNKFSKHVERHQEEAKFLEGAKEAAYEKVANAKIENAGDALAITVGIHKTMNNYVLENPPLEYVIQTSLNNEIEHNSGMKREIESLNRQLNDLKQIANGQHYTIQEQSAKLEHPVQTYPVEFGAATGLGVMITIGAMYLSKKISGKLKHK